MPRRVRRSAVAALGTIAVGIAACTAATGGRGVPARSTFSPSPAPSVTTSSPPAPEITFRNCARQFNLAASGIPADRLAHLRFECGRLDVPLDYAHPSANGTQPSANGTQPSGNGTQPGATTTLGMLRIHDTRQSSRLGSLLVDPGGPGGSGVFLAFSLAATMSEDVLNHFDLVGFDPRGVNLSSPVACVSDSLKDRQLAANPDVRTSAGLAAAKRLYAEGARACNTKYGAALAHFNTVETVKDMDRIRAGLGDPQLTYLGFSYGTVLGSVYGHLYPHNVRAAVLDGAVDPSRSGSLISWTELQTRGFEDAFDQFAADCRRHSPCASLGDPRAAAAALVRQAAAAPIPSARPGEQRKATAGNVLLAITDALYARSAWPRLAAALLAAQGGDASGLLALDDEYGERDQNGHYDNLLDMYVTVTCNDLARNPTDAQVTANAKAWAVRYPLFGLWMAYSLTMCAGWQPHRTPLPAPDATGSRPILVVGNLHDPATPYQGAVTMARQLRTGVLLTWDGEGHTSYGRSSCIDQKVDAYLIAQVVPPTGTRCAR